MVDNFPTIAEFITCLEAPAEKKMQMPSSKLKNYICYMNVIAIDETVLYSADLKVKHTYQDHIKHACRSECKMATGILQ